MRAEDYVVIPKSVLEDRIKELSDKGFNDSYKRAINQLNDILSQSKPLLPIISDAWDNGYYQIDDSEWKQKQDYLNKEI